MPFQGQMSELASSIQTHTARIEEYLLAQGHALPSLGVDAIDVGPLPQQLSISRDTILDSIDELRELTLGPMGYLMKLTAPHVRRYSRMSRLILMRPAYRIYL